MNFRYLFVLFSFAILAATPAFCDNNFDQAYFKKHLNTNIYSVDSDASAVVLFESAVISINFETDQFTQKETIHRIIKILKKDALDAADIKIFYPKEDFRNYIHNVKGTTYNLVGNEPVATQLVNKDLLKKKVSERTFSASFSLPNVKEGSIIDYTYEVVTELSSEVCTWDVQDEYPKLISTFKFIHPAELEYTAVTHVRGRQKQYSDEDDAMLGTDNFAYVKTSNTDGVKTFWVRRNISGVKEEPYVVNVKNEEERLDMQLTGVGRYFALKHYNNTWERINVQIWKEELLKKEITAANHFMDVTIDSIIKPSMTESEKSMAIFKYVRNNFKRNEKTYSFSRIDVKKTFNTHEGSSGDINALLTAMLLKAGVNAAPIIMSTTSNISASETFPVLDRINFMACAVYIDSSYILLDASNKNNNFGALPTYCYNGFAWILGDKGKGMNLTPDLLKDKTMYGVKIFGFTDSTAKLELTIKYGMISSPNIRKAWAGDKDKQKEDIQAIKNELPTDVVFSEPKVDNLNNPDTNLVIRLTCELSFDKKADNLYLNANMIKMFAKNPFKETKRKLPIEFPYQTEYAYFMTVVLPENMEPDSTYAPILINYDQDAINYKKLIGYYPSIHSLSVNTNLNIKTTFYGIDYYPSLREFFQKMIDADNQALVIKKKKG